MTFYEFTNMVKDHVSELFGSKYTVTIQPVEKNNGVQYQGIMILQPGKNLSPLIYLDPYYHQYLNGMSIDDICEDVYHVYRKKLQTSNLNISFFFDYEKVRRRLIPKLINYDKNLALLADVPHIRILDLAVVFLCLIHPSDTAVQDCPDSSDGSATDSYATILIHNHHMQYWQTTVQDLFTNALSNAQNLFPPSVCDLHELLEEYEMGSECMEESHVSETDCSGKIMYILSNSCRINGAAVILYEHLLANLADRFASNLVILPSSIHEVILVPVQEDDMMIQMHHFSNMVQEVNEMQVADDEVLSDHAYYYIRDSQELISI